MFIDHILNNLKLNKEEFLFQFRSHPDYPSILAFSDTLNFMGIKNDAYEIDKADWHDLPERFITQYKNNFALVEMQNINNYKLYTDKTEVINNEQLYHNSSNFVMLLEKTDQIQEINKINFNRLLYLLFALIVFYSIVQLSWHQSLYNIISILGVYISLEIFNRKFGKESYIINNLCTTSTKSPSQSGCTKIIDSDKINIWGLKLSDFSLIYFLGLMVIGLFSPYTEFILKIFSIASIIVIIYSLSVQLFIEKTFCKICLTTIILLIIQIIIASLLFGFHFNLKILLISAFIFLISFVFILFINDVLTKQKKYQTSSLKNLRFKRNYDIFKRELQEKSVLFNHNNLFWIGNKDAKLHISMITNPYCGYCKDAHIILEKLINSYPSISAQIRFNYFSDSTDENLTQIITIFKNLYDLEGEKSLLKAITFWYEKTDPENFKQKYSTYLDHCDLSEIMVISEENKKNNLVYTPTFIINHHQFPNKYDRDDIFYFMDELIEDEEILNEKI